MPSRLKCLLIGWSGADWNLLNPLVDAGRMPHLQGLLESGVMGELASTGPQVPELEWTTLATGMTADRHGILTSYEPDPLSGGVRRSGARSRRTKALWNILEEAGLRAHTACWPATHPAAAGGGVHVSDAFPRATAPYGLPWPIERESVQPYSAEASLLDLRVHPGELDGNGLLQFIPRLAEIDQGRDRRVAQLAVLLAEAITTHAAATWILESQPWDFLAVHYGAIAAARAVFANCGGTPYEQATTETCCYLDAMLGRLLQLAGPGCITAIVSPRGMVCLSGPGFRCDELLYGAGVLDIVPTVLASLGLPAGADMPGRPLAGAFLDARFLPRIATWESEPAPNGGFDLAAAGRRELSQLGYDEQIPDSLRELAEKARTEQRFHLALVHLDNGQVEESAEQLGKLVAEHPANMLFRAHFAYASLRAGRKEECRAACGPLQEDDASRPIAQLLLGALAAFEGNHEEALGRIRDAAGQELPAALRCLAGQAYQVLNQREEAERAFRAAIAGQPGLAEAHHGLARILLEEGNFEQAADAALTAISIQFNSPPTHYLLGMALAGMGRLEHSIQAFETCLHLQPDMTAATDWIAALQKRAVS